MFNKLTCKVRFHIAVWSLSKSIRASSFIENFPQISAKPIAFQRNLLGGAPTKSAVLYQSFFQENWPPKFPRNSRVIGRFSREFAPENPAKFDFFSATYQKPCYKNTITSLELYHMGWVFFSDICLPLVHVLVSQGLSSGFNQNMNLWQTDITEKKAHLMWCNSNESFACYGVLVVRKHERI